MRAIALVDALGPIGLPGSVRLRWQTPICFYNKTLLELFARHLPEMIAFHLPG